MNDNRAALLYIDVQRQKINDGLRYMISEIRKYSQCVYAVLSAAPYNGQGTWNGLIDGVFSFFEFEQNWENISSKYEEIIFLSDQVYGPIWPLTDFFAFIEEDEDADIYGMNEWGYKLKVLSGENVAIPEPTFFVIRTSLKVQALLKEVDLSQRRHLLEKLLNGGATCKVYRSIYEIKGLSLKREEDYSSALACELISHGVPFLPKRSMERENLRIGATGNAKKTLNYISQYSTFNIGYIWEDLLENNNLLDLYYALHLDYVFPDKYCLEEREINAKVAVVINLFYIDLLDICFNYIRRIPDFIDVFLCVSNDELQKEVGELIEKNQLSNCRIMYKNNRGRDISALLVACRELLQDYKYFCFIHDKKSSYKQYELEGKSFFDTLWENTLKSDSYIFNVLQCFEENDKLGLLGPPIPNYGGMLNLYNGNGWNYVNFDNVSTLMDELGIHANVSMEKSALFFGTAFWCRTCSLKPLLEKHWRYEDFPEEPMENNGTVNHAIERILTYVAQSQGYYSGILMNEEYAVLQSTNTSYLLRMALRKINQFIPVFTVEQLEREEEGDGLLDFCHRHDKIFIYGAGQYGTRISKILKRLGINVAGFLVSDLKNNKDMVENLPVHNVYEAVVGENDGIVVAVSKSSQGKICDLLEELQIENVFCVV